MPLPLIIAGGVALAAGAYKTHQNNKQAKGALAAQKAIDYKNSVARGRSILATDQAYALPDYNDDPFSVTERKLYADGGTAGAADSYSPYLMMAQSVLGAVDSTLQYNNAKKALKYEVSKTPVNEDKSLFINDAQRDNRVAMLNDPLRYAFGGPIQQSSDTAIIKAGTHESGKDVGFVKPDGTQARIEGNEGMRDTGKGVQIYSDRISVPGTNHSIAAEFSHLSSLKGNLEKTAKTTGDVIARNTADRRIEGVTLSLDNLFKVQEGIKGIGAIGNGVQKAGQQQFSLGGFDDEPTDEFLPPSYKLMMDKLGIDTDPKPDLTKKIDNHLLKQPVKVESKLKAADPKQLAVPVKAADPKQLAVPVEGEEGKDKTKKGFYMDNGKLNTIATGLTLLDNIYNAGVLDKMGDINTHLVNKVDLDKEYDVTAQENAVKTELDNFYKNVDKNTTSSVVGLNMKLAAMADGIGKLNEVYSTKEKFETEMKNKEILANSGIEQFNASEANRYARQDLMTLSGKSANFSNAIDDVVNGMLRGVDYRTQKERFVAQEQAVSETGVGVKNLMSGNYVTLSANEINKIVADGVKSGNLKYDDYASAMKAHIQKGGKGKVLSKAEFEKLK